ncbi:MAG: primosomal protein N' [Deltaproteobacteria bacterium]|nr:primosomal protein N' [Deltaproteobacteria bacterium]
MSSGARLAQVAVGRPVRGAYTYAIPEALESKLVPGVRISVPFGRGKALGFFLGEATAPPPVTPKSILEVLDPEPALTPDVLRLVTWAAEYYRHPLGEALRGALPPGMAELRAPPEARAKVLTWVEPIPRASDADDGEVRGALMRAVLSYLEACGRTEMEELSGAVPGARDAVKRLAARGRVRVTTEARDDSPGTGALAGAAPLELSNDQARALAALEKSLESGGFAPFLLHGVTGSGKTEVYLRAIAKTRALGKRALCLVPEIGLTPQLVGRFRARFGDEVAVLHSGLKDAERLQEWRRIRSGEAPVAVGVRSAIFAPVRDLGLLVVDEEHDPSFKQDEKLRYHARDLAVVRAQHANCPVVLGSATPSLETLSNARSGKYALLSLPARIDDRPLPKVEVVDLRIRPAASHQPPATDPREASLLSPALKQALSETLDRGEQAILFLNRRGHSTFVTCTVCGLTVTCPNCSIALTHHLARRGLLCHHCGHTAPLPEHCPECRGALLRLGVGTEKVEEEVARDFPAARVLRLDRDSAGDAAELTRTLADFARGAANVMIGTQMVAKGHDFPGVTLVGVVLADTALAMPDFRAAERTFQVLAQVAGRAGRGAQAGRVLVQTYNPDSDAVARVVGHDFDGFAQAELRRREALGFPPYAKLLAVRVDGLQERATIDAARRLADVAERQIRRGREPLRLLGPTPAPLVKLRGRTRWQLLLKARGHAAMNAVVQALEAAADELPPGVRASFDVDPVNLL